MKSDLKYLEQSIGYNFRNINLLEEAIQHSSYVNEQPGNGIRDNERLEFLGDSVLDLVISHILMEKFPAMREGELSRVRATIVKTDQLAIIAKKLNLGEHLRLGRGESMCRGDSKNSILADVLEALIAAVYMDGGFLTAFDFVSNHFREVISGISVNGKGEDFKSRLQEMMQNRFKSVPRYEVRSESGPDHAKIFDVRVTVGELVTGFGRGKSKKAAEQEAARTALHILENREVHE